MGLGCKLGIHVAENEVCQQRGREVVLPVRDGTLMTCSAETKSAQALTSMLDGSECGGRRTIR